MVIAPAIESLMMNAAAGEAIPHAADREKQVGSVGPSELAPSFLLTLRHVRDALSPLEVIKRDVTKS
jgi:hypothetical protein